MFYYNLLSPARRMPTPSFGAAGRRGGASRHRPHGHGAQWIFRQRKYLAGTTEGGMCAIKKKNIYLIIPPPPPPPSFHYSVAYMLTGNQFFFFSFHFMSFWDYFSPPSCPVDCLVHPLACSHFGWMQGQNLKFPLAFFIAPLP